MSNVAAVDDGGVRSERRNFQLHMNILRDIITKQSGTIAKAFLEGIMNLVDAGATRGDITLTSTRFTIDDDGKGFATRQEVLDAFEMFGKSDERKEQERVYGFFQQGRGQIMAWGKTRYRTRTFAMDVDINSAGVPQYELTEGLEDKPGCSISVELYHTLDVFAIAEIVKQTKRAARFVSVPIYLNGQLISEQPEKIKWDLETEHAYYRFSNVTTRLDIYNLGVFVETMYDFGIGGTVVSKERLTLSSGRNEVVRTCPVWKNVRSEFRARTQKSLLDKKAFGVDDAATVLAMIRNGEIPLLQAAGLKVLRDTNNKPRAFRDVQRRKVGFDKRGSVKADRAMQLNPGVVILDREFVREMLASSDDKLDYDFAVMCRQMSFNPHNTSLLPEIVPVESLYVEFQGDSEVIPDEKVDKVLRTALEGLRSAAVYARYDYSGQPGYNQYSFSNRHIKLGRSDTSTAWTDGRSYIVISVDEFKKHIWSVGGWTDLLLMVAEMYAYTSDDRTRDLEYLERFHEYVGSFVRMNGRAFREFTRIAVRRHPDKARRLRLEATAQAALEGREIADEDVSADDVTDGFVDGLPDELDDENGTDRSDPIS